MGVLLYTKFLSQPYGSTTLSGHLIRVKQYISHMKLTKQHFVLLAKIAGDMLLFPEQQIVLMDALEKTNHRFDRDRFYDAIRLQEIINEEGEE